MLAATIGSGAFTRTSGAGSCGFGAGVSDFFAHGQGWTGSQQQEASERHDFGPSTMVAEAHGAIVLQHRSSKAWMTEANFISDGVTLDNRGSEGNPKIRSGKIGFLAGCFFLGRSLCACHGSRVADDFFPEPRANARFAFGMAKFLVPAALVGFVVAARYGLANVGYLLLALPFGLAWLFLLMLSWRKQNHLFGGLAFIVVVLMPNFFGVKQAAEPQQWQFFCLVFLAAFIPLLLLRRQISRWCLLDEGAPQ